MKRILKFKSGIIGGDTVREIINLFPSTENRFTQRKTYDEYYYEEIDVELTIDNINDLSKLGFIITINWESILVE